MSWTKQRRKYIEGAIVKEFRPNEQKSVDKTAVEMLNSGGGKRLKKNGKTTTTLRRFRVCVEDMATRLKTKWTRRN